MAQLALNALKTPVVEAEDGTLNVSTSVGGATTQVTAGKVNYKVTASSDAYARAISAVEGSDQTTINGIQGYVIELGEKLYDGKLQLRENGVNGNEVYDDFGRPARRWQYDGKTFGTYAKVEDLRQEYTTKVTGKMLYDELGSDIVTSVEKGDQWKMNVTIDGETHKSVLDRVWDGTFFSINSIKRYNTDAVGKTGNGVLTQVYVDSVHHIVDIAVINTYLAIAEQDYNSKDDDVDLKVYRILESGSQTKQYVKAAKSDKAETIIAATGDDFDIENVKDGDKFLVTVAQGKIQSMTAPEIVSETTINSFKEGDWVKNSDVQYDYAATAQYDDEVLDEYDVTNMKNVTYNVILDKYGYLVGLELNEELNQYLFLTGIDLGDSNLSYKNASANVIFADGTMSTVTVNVADSEYAAKPTDPAKNYTVTGGGEDLNAILDHVPAQTKEAGGTFKSFSRVNTWCTYSVDSNNVYTLKQVGTYSIARTDSPAVKGAKKIAQSAFDVDTVTLSGDRKADELVINNKNTSLPGAKNTDASVFPGVANADNDFNWVYGNNETVYINVSLKGVQSKDAGQSAIINKVESVVTGIANADYTVKDIAYATTGTDYNSAEVPAEEIYTLYNDKGYAIAVIMIGADDNGATSRFVYVTKGTNQEDYTGSDTWVWHANGILDGLKGELTEARNTRKYLDKLVAGNWYSVTYDKDGHVNGLRTEDTLPGTQSNINFTNPTTDRFITSVADIEDALNNGGTFTDTKGKTLLLQADYTCNGSMSHTSPAGSGTAKLHVEGDTLYVTPDNTTGFRINDDTKTVLILSKGHNNTSRFDSITDGYTGQSGLRKALNDLGTLMTVENGRKVYVFDGILNAVINSNGVATSIILEDQSGNGHPGVGESVPAMKVTINLLQSGSTTPFATVEDWITADTTYTTTAQDAFLADYGLDTELTATAARTVAYDEAAATRGEGKTVTFTYKTKPAVAPTEVTVDVLYKAGDKIVGMDTATLPVKTMQTDTQIVAAGETGLPANYELVNGDNTNAITASTTSIDIAVQWEMVTLKLASSKTVTASWTADTNKGIAGPGADGSTPVAVTTAGVKVPKGVELTLAGSDVGKYNSTGDVCTTLDPLTEAETTLADTDYGYYKVSLGADPARTDWTVEDCAITGADANGDKYVKKGEMTEVTVTFKMTAPAAGENVAAAKAATVTGSGLAMKSGADEVLAVKNYTANEEVNVSVVVEVTANNADLEIALTIAA